MIDLITSIVMITFNLDKSVTWVITQELNTVTVHPMRHSTPRDASVQTAEALQSPVTNATMGRERGCGEAHNQGNKQRVVSSSGCLDVVCDPSNVMMMEQTTGSNRYGNNLNNSLPQHFVHEPYLQTERIDKVQHDQTVQVSEDNIDEMLHTSEHYCITTQGPITNGKFKGDQTALTSRIVGEKKSLGAAPNAIGALKMR